MSFNPVDHMMLQDSPVVQALMGRAMQQQPRGHGGGMLGGLAGALNPMIAAWGLKGMQNPQEQKPAPVPNQPGMPPGMMPPGLY